MPVKQRISVYLDAEMMARLEKLADKERTAKSSIAEAAIMSFLTADDSDRWEAAVTRRMDRLTRSVDRMERDLEFSVEALALYIRAWLTATPPLPDNAQAAAQAKARSILRQRRASASALSRASRLIRCGHAEPRRISQEAPKPR